MSRNFELMRQMEEGGIFAGLSMPAAAPYTEREEPAHGGNGTHGNGNGSQDVRARAEIARLVHTLFLSGMNAPHQVLFCSVDEGEASGRLCVAAGELLAGEAPLPVCVVDAKVRAPSLDRFFHANGYATSRGNGAGRLNARQVGSNLWFLSLDTTLSNGDLARTAEQLKASLREVRKEFGYVLIDAEPVGQPADAAALGSATDGVVLVLEANGTRREAALRVTENFRTSKIPVLGAVLNNRTFPIPSALYKRL